MKLKRGKWFLPLFCALLCVSSFAMAVEKPSVTFLTTSIRPGDFFQMQVKATPDAKVTVKFLDTVKQLYSVDKSESFFGMVAATYRTQPGKYPLTVEVTDDKGTVTQEQMIEVVPRKFVEQRIYVSEKMRQSTATDEKMEADAKIGVEVRKLAESRHLGPLWDGAFIMPLNGKKTSDFGQIRYVNDIDHGRHSGWDLAAKSGVPVAAINRGQVVFAGKLYATGNTIIIHHGLDLYSSYGHLSAINVTNGAMVTKGQVIGKVGMTGLATGPHLHLTVRVGSIPVDPALLMDKTIEWKD